MKERREFIREQADWLAEIYTDDTIYTSPVRNLSYGGAELMRPPLWKPKPHYTFRICFSDMIPSHTLEVHMQVCWVTKARVGLKYHDLGLSEKIKLNKIISDISIAITLESGHL